MAKLPPKKSEDGGGDWLNTYADMVTLLLTFFVLLFACSNLDETKLQYVFQEFKSRGKFVNQFLTEQDPYATDPAGGTTDNSEEVGGEGTMPESFEELYVYLAEYIDNNNLSDSIAVEQGETHIRIKLNSAVLFAGDSYYLTEEGKAALDGMIPMIRAVSPMISRNTVSGHTSVGTSIVNDWMLSSMRAVSVINYVDAQKMMETEKYRLSAAGPYEPDPDNTENDPAKNRRVEMLLLKNELDITDIKVIQDILEHDYNVGSAIFDPDNLKPDDSTKLPPGAVDKIVEAIKDKFASSSEGVTSVGSYGPMGVDGNKFIPADDTSGGDGGASGGGNSAAGSGNDTADGGSEASS